MTTKTIAELTDADVKASRFVAVLDDDGPVLVGRLLGVNAMHGRVALDLDVAGLRVFVEPLAEVTRCEVAT